MSGWLDRVRFQRDHRWAPGRMSDYLDGDLVLSGHLRMERHLRECAQCRRLLADLRRIVAGLRGLSAPAASPDPTEMAASVRARLIELD